MTSRDEALKVLDDIFNYCEEIDYSLPENERSGYKMLPDIQKIRKYIIDNTRPRGEWVKKYNTDDPTTVCSVCCFDTEEKVYFNFCPNCGADMREGDAE